MKHKYPRVLVWMLAGAALPLTILNSPAQTKIVFNSFVNAAEVADTARGGGDAWRNWFGTAFYQLYWDPSDASNNVNSGSLKVEAYFPDSGIGGQYGPQFYVMNGFNGYTNSTYPKGIPGNGNTSIGIAVATNVEFDVRFDPTSCYDTNNNVWPWLNVGTAGVNASQNAWQSYVSYSHDNTNWFHRSVPIPAGAAWTNIPNIYFQYWNGSWTGPNFVSFYLDNITFTFEDIQQAPTNLPSLTVEKAKPSLRMISGNNQYDRIQLASVDTNQSWVGGSYPVSYSFTVSKIDPTTPLNEFHVFLTPLNSVQGGAINSFTDYSYASNNFRLLINGGAVGSSAAIAAIGWKTNLVNANPNNVALTITNPTTIGTWTITFTNATGGTLTAPGASPAPFSLPADVAATFANPLVAFFGVQPDPTSAIGQYVDLTQIQTIGVASPGVPINSVFNNSAPIDTNIWRTASVSADASNLVVVNTDSALWLNWSAPDFGAGLAAAATVNAGYANWKTPAYYAGTASTNIVKKLVGSRNWELLPSSALPAANSSFFRLEWPAPAQ